MPKSDVRRFEVGESVLARWPGSSLYFMGKVLDYNDSDYLVRFEDEDQSELAIKYKNVEAPYFNRRSRSRSQGRSSLGRNSPARKSPSRKSPSRRSPSKKSPSRKSPGRKSNARKSPARSSPVRHSSFPKMDLDSEKQPPSILPSILLNSKDSSPPLRSKIETTVLSGSTSLSSSTISDPPHSTEITSIDKKLLAEDNFTISNRLKVDSAKVVEAMEQRNRLWQFMKRGIFCTWETLKALPLPIFLFCLPFLLTLMCTTKKCNLQIPTFPSKISYLLEQKPLAMATGYLISLLILALIPLGKVVHTDRGSKIRCNAYASVVVVAVVVGILLKMDVNLASMYLFYRHFLLLFSALGIILSAFLYIKSFGASKAQLNPKGNTGYYLVDFIRGREVAPRIGSFDLKFFLFRVGLISTIFLNLLIVAKNLQGKPGHYSPTLLVVSGMQVFHCLDFLLFEDSFLSTYEYTAHGMGLTSCLIYLNFAFISTFFSKFILNHGVELIWYFLVGIVALNLLGYTILRGANSQKHAFRTNPSDPALVHLESLPTSTKKLLVSGWWGLVRHPNYLGELIVHLSWCLPCGFNHNIPWLIFALHILHLLVRISVVEKSCRDKYGLAWSSYTTRVPHKLIPKVF